MGGRGRSSGKGLVGGGGFVTPGALGGSAGSASAGPDHAEVPKEEIQRAVDAAIARMPARVRTLLESQGTKTHVLTVKEAVKLAGPDAKNWRGFYAPKSRQAHVIVDNFQHAGGGRNSGMTALHELGHAYDYQRTPGTRLTDTPGFKAALAKDQKNLQRVKLSAGQRERMQYLHYPAGSRAKEIFAETFAAIYGVGRPKPAKQWNNSQRIKTAYPNVTKFIKGLK